MLNTATPHVSDITPEGKGLLSPESIAALDASVKELFAHYLAIKQVGYEGEPDIKVSEQAADGKVRVIRDSNHLGDGKWKKRSMDSRRIGFLKELFGDEMLYLNNDITFDMGPPIIEKIGLHGRSSSVTLRPKQLVEAIDKLSEQYGITPAVKSAAMDAQQATQLGAAKG